MKVFDGNWKAFFARTTVFCIAAFGTIRLAVARDGVAGGPARSLVTVAGTLTGVSGATPVTFEFRRVGSTTVLCTPQVTITPGAGGAFSVPVPLDLPELSSRCPDDLFDGRDVQVRALAGGNEVAGWALINPVPYAHFASVAGIAGAARGSGPYGLSLLYDSAGRLCVQCNGATCSDSNPGFVVFSNGSSAQIAVDRVVTNSCVADARSTAPDLNRQPFGTTVGAAWSQDRPFALYACRGSSGPLFALSPDPTFIAVPAASRIALPGRPVMELIDSVLFFWGTAAPSGSPCMLIGSFRMQKNALDNWTVSTLDAGDGINHYSNFGARSFTMPTGQRGAPAGQYLKYDYPYNPTWVLPTYRSVQYTYSIGQDGYVDGAFHFKNNVGDPGTVPGSSSSTNMVLVVPNIPAQNALAGDRVGSGTSVGFGLALGTRPSGFHMFRTVVLTFADVNSLWFFYNVPGTDGDANEITPNDQGSEERSLRGSFRYRAFPQ